MYLLKEGSVKAEKIFVTLPSVSPNIKENQPLFFPEETTAIWFYQEGMAEKKLIEWVYENMITSDKAFIDIGAHVGTYTWTCGKKASHTYSFECSPKTFCYLAANVALHRLEYQVSLFNVALGNEEKEVEYIIRSEDGGGNGIKTLSSTDQYFKRVNTPMRTLDSYHLEQIGFIKIDVEGFEKEVLEGARETLERNNYPPILFESWGPYKELEGVPSRQLRMELFTLLDKMGYEIIHFVDVIDIFLAKYKR
jgi:FkbM family methyltransferase